MCQPYCEQIVVKGAGGASSEYYVYSANEKWVRRCAPWMCCGWFFEALVLMGRGGSGSHVEGPGWPNEFAAAYHLSVLNVSMNYVSVHLTVTRNRLDHAEVQYFGIPRVHSASHDASDVDTSCPNRKPRCKVAISAQPAAIY